MTNGRLGVFAGLLLLVFLVSQIPSRVLAIALPGSVHLEGFSGTLWHGRAARASVMMGGKQFQLGRLDWSLHPLSLLLLSPSLDISSQWGTQRIAGEVSIGFGQELSLSNTTASLDVGFSRQLMPLYVGGVLQADIKHLELKGRTPQQIDGRLVWQDAVWTARSGDVALGNYVLELAGEEANVQGKVMTLSGPLSVEGALALTQGQYTVDMQLTGPATTNEGLRQSLMLLASPTADGFAMKLDGAL